MKSLKNYLAEAEFIATHPVPGDVFGIELATDSAIETVVAELTEAGHIIIELDRTAIRMLAESGMYLQEDPTMPSPSNSETSSAIPGHGNKLMNSEDGTLSPISGNAFAPYDRKADPRTWFRKDVKPMAKGSKRPGNLGTPNSPGMMESVYVRDMQGIVSKLELGNKAQLTKYTPAESTQQLANEQLAPRPKANYWTCRSW